MSNYFQLLEHCELCPRKCGVNRRAGERGYCNSGSGFEIASVCLHRGEEPPISGKNGICNVFFSHCNLQCVYCQNGQISDNQAEIKEMTFENVISQIVALLESGSHALGFVSPTHFLPQVIAIITKVRGIGYNPVTVWNSNGFELPEMLEILDPFIDVFMPDFKYADGYPAEKYSGAKDYPRVALAAIQKMKDMRGTRLLLDDEGQAYRGMLIRHLVLPGHSEQSIEVLNIIVRNISQRIPLSLMSQYHPEHKIKNFPEMDCLISPHDYNLVVEKMKELELSGWIQPFSSAKCYLPDFKREHPFE